MSSHEKKKVVIASTLKPVDDTRLYEKLASTLSQTGRYECHIIGAPGGPVVDMETHPLPAVARLTRARFFLPFRILTRVFRLRPDLLIIGTHELLFVAAVYRLFTRKPTIYDIQENYYLNILHTNVFPSPLRRLIANWVRLKELAVAPFISKFVLAEKGFENELPFVRERSVVIENKVIIPEGFARRPPTDAIELLFSGTIDESTGVFEAIALTRHLHEINPNYTLHIIGYCARPDALEIIRDMIAPFPFMRLSGGDTLQPHSLIMEAISKASFGLIFYRPSPHINNRMPTKLYEYMACRLPILIRDDLWWCEFVEKARAGVAVDVEGEAQFLIDSLQGSTFYPAGNRNMNYEFDRQTLVESIDSIFSAIARKGQTASFTTTA